MPSKTRVCPGAPAVREKAVEAAEARAVVAGEVVDAVVGVAAAAGETDGQPHENHHLCWKILRNLFFVSPLANR